MASKSYEIIIIGSGPAGESAAMNAAKSKRNVAMICDKPRLGGNSAYHGTIPSKALRNSVRQLLVLNRNPMFRDLADVKTAGYEQIIKHAEHAVEEQLTMHTANYERNNIPVIHGSAHFLDKNTIEVVEGKKKSQLKAEYFIITTGSRPYRPEFVDFNHPRVFDSDTVLGLNHTPRKVTIIGAGVIGSEYASIFAGLGIKVELINPASSLLSFLDNEITDALSYHLGNLGVRCHHQEHFDKMECHDDSVITFLQSGKKIKSDIVLWANGRTGNTDRLKLENIGLKANSRGQLAVNDHYQTEVENIYAAGDVIGWPSLASAAFDQGRAACNAIVNPDEFFFIRDIPTGIYTIPEISTIGLNEQELTEQKVPYEVGKAYFRNIARAQITGEDVGMLKIIFHFDTLEILGIHCFGAQASEIVHIGQAIMSQKGEANSLKYFLNTTFNYPTMAEAYKVAAYDGYNRVF
ncbi:MAG: Si-specific NAD(P)(+) transhydrogenase [Gammaproteobacteria bacterium]|nr:Si-specific NAD(P)(+) transhydrogenase [Gammaproteobacteria bacterium]|tara:strand:- start:529 stop:1920 length:1392 start_codon:yes stop_codon:yes gene_type:complete